MPKTITFLASGTLGDVLPCLALGRGLQAAGYGVVIATHANFRPLVENARLGFALLDGNPSELMLHSGGQSALAFDGNWMRSARATWQYVRAARPVYEKMLASAWQACRSAESIVIGLPTTWGVHIAEALSAPCLGCFLQPFGPTSVFPSALLPATFSLGPLYNRVTYLMMEQALWQPWRSVINRWRRGTLGLRSSPLTGPRIHDTPVLYGFSQQVLPRPDDWPPSHLITGYWFWDEALAPTPSSELKRFLEKGPAVYVGFGSPGARRPDKLVSLVVRAIKAAGLRAVFALPHDSTRTIALPSNILPVGEVSHGWLLPRVAAVAHHGGAGTTGNSLRAGAPTLILPHAVDQFFWGERVAALGVGPAPLPQRALTAEALARALRQAVDYDGMRRKAQNLGERIREEDGVKRAVEIMRTLV